MNGTIAVDAFDLRLLDALQADGARTNQQLAELVRLSPSQVSRRRQRLEEEGLIRRYRADLDAVRLGFGRIAYEGLRTDRFSGPLFQPVVTVTFASADLGSTKLAMKR